MQSVVHTPGLYISENNSWNKGVLTYLSSTNDGVLARAHFRNFGSIIEFCSKSYDLHVA